MNDIFNEQLVARKPNRRDMFMRAGIAVGGIALLAVAMSFNVLSGFLIPIAAVIIAGEVYLLRSMNIEYEYVFTNGDLDIDRITNKSRRKQVLSINVRSFVTMVPVAGNNYEGEINQYTKMLDYGSGVVGENTYAAIYEEDGQRVKLIIEPDEEMFKAIRSYIPRVVKK